MTIVTAQTDQPRINLSMPDAPDTNTRFSTEDVALLRKSLGEGMAGFARQGDIIELHKRIGEKFAKLPEEIAGQIARMTEQEDKGIDRTNGKLDALEQSLDRLEGSVRIELVPIVEDVLRRTLRESGRVPHSKWRFGILVLMLMAGWALGWVWHDQLASASAGGIAYVEDIFRSASN